MKAKMILSLLAVGVVLAGCSEKSESVNSDKVITQNESSTQESAQQSTQQQEAPKKVDVTESFAPVLADVKLMNGNRGKKGVNVQNLNLNVISSEVASGIIDLPENVKYAAYDINKDGKDELLLGTKGRDGYFTLAAYYLDSNNKIVSLGDSLALDGGYRSAVTIYQDGSIYSANWSSASGDGKELVKKIEDGGASVSTVASADVRQLQWQLFNKGSLTKNNEVDLNALEWKDVD